MSCSGVHDCLLAYYPRVPVKREGAVDRAKAARGYLVTQASYNIKSSHPKFAAYLHGEGVEECV